MLISARMASLRERTFSGLGWNAATQFSAQALQFATSLVIVRLLGPQELGLMGMAMVFVGFASIFYEMGLGAALIQRPGVSDLHVNSVFWINVGMAVVLTFVFVTGASAVAMFYGQPVLGPLTMVVSLSFIPAALSIVHTSLIDRELRFRARFGIEITAALLSGSVAIVMALYGAGVWSLAAQSLVSAATRMIVAWRLSAWRPAWIFDRAAFKELFRFSGNLLGNGVVHYWGRNADRLILGRFEGSTSLGLYSLAFRSISLPLDLTTNVTNAVMFPAFSLIQGDVEKLKGVYLRSTRMIALVMFPTMMGLAILAEPILLTLYGSRWRGTIPVVQVLAFSGMAQSVYNTATWLFLAQGQTGRLFRLGIYATLVRACGAAIGIHWGTLGVAWAYLVGTCCCLWYPVWYYAGRQVNLRVRELLHNLRGPFLCTAGMGAVVWACDRWILAGFAPWLRLAAGAPLGVLLYFRLIQRFQLEAWSEVRSALLEAGGGKLPVLRRLLLI